MNTTQPIKLIRKQANSPEFAHITQERVAYKLDNDFYLVYLPNQEVKGCLYAGRWEDILNRYDVIVDSAEVLEPSGTLS